MKKLFSIFFVLAMLLPMSMYGQLLGAIAEDIHTDGELPKEANLVRGRNNTPPNVTWNLAWGYADEGNTVMNTNGYKYLGATSSGIKVYRYQWDSDLQIYFAFSDNSATWTSPISGATCVMPARGTYTVSTSIGNFRIGAYGSAWDGNGTQSRYVEGTSYYFSSGTWYVEEGVDGPCMYSTNCYLRNAGTNKLIIGDPAVYKNVTVRTDDNTTTKGTVSYSMLSGYVYTTNITDWKQGSTYRLTASAKSGYHFEEWQKNGSTISTDATTDVTIDEDATYTASFAPDAATQYTVNTAVNNNSLGSVTAGGDKYENSVFNISATINDPANYYLSDWLRDGVSMGVRTNPLPVTVTKAETYTAVITAKEWTLTVNSDNTSLGTVSGGKKCYDGETTTITATPANSFSSFVKWQKNGVDYAGGASINVTVNANDTYTAFFSGRNIIEVDIPNATYVDRWSIYSLRGNSNGTSSENSGYYVDVACNTSNNALSSVDGIKYNGSTMSFTTKTIESIEQPCGNRKITNLACYNATGDVYMFKIHWTQPWGEDSNDTYPNDRTINANQQAAYDDDLGAIYVYGYTKEYEWNGQATLRAMGMYFVTGQRCSDDIKIPVGTYEINCSGDPGTVMSYQSGMDKDLSGGWAQTQGVEHGYYLLDKGTVTVTKSGSTYTINVNAKNSYGNDLISTMTIDESVISGTIPNYTLNVTTDGHGTATVKRYDCSGNLNAVSNSGSFKQGSYFQLEASPSSGYAFDYWTIDGVDEHFTNNPETLDGLYSNATITAHFRTAINYEVTITSPTNGTVTVSYNDGSAQSFTSGSREIAEGTTLTVTTTPANGYQFSAWTNDGAASVTVDETKTIGATFAPILYTITYNGLEGATNTNPISYNIESETITLADPETRDGYVFAGWKDESDNTITQIAQGSTGNRTLTATWNAKSSDIVLCEDCENAHYNTFKTNYDGETVNVTYNRRFTQSRWSTMCLPFNLDLAALITHKMYGRVYEFKYATGNANVGSGVNLYFSNAKSIEAGKCYIVNANSALAAKTSFVFSGVTIDLSKDNGADLSSVATPEASVAAYNALPGYKSEGTIELVGTLRNGILMGTATGNKYMGLKENKIYYPNTDTGSTIWAYRGIFRSTETLNVEKMRIVVDGEDRGEIRIDNGELIIDNGSPVRKFIRNGNLYIEREGVIYDAQGKRVE